VPWHASARHADMVLSDVTERARRGDLLAIGGVRWRPVKDASVFSTGVVNNSGKLEKMTAHRCAQLHWPLDRGVVDPRKKKPRADYGLVVANLLRGGSFLVQLCAVDGGLQLRGGQPQLVTSSSSLSMAQKEDSNVARWHKTIETIRSEVGLRASGYSSQPLKK
jgi:hypothetical protein